ncbi:MAG: hypothetical protein ACRYHQ_18210 [Janthinobacterium lividum]
MSVKFLLAAALTLSVGSGVAFAQTSAPTRNPVLGDKGSQPSTARPSAKAVAKADKQPPGTENGNQPDRAAAGGGAR